MPLSDALQHAPRPFSPHPLLRSAHLQTLFAAVPAKALAPRGMVAERMSIALPDGDTLSALGMFRVDGAQRPAALLVHGVGGSRQSAYVVRAQLAIAQAGFHAVAIDLRGAGEGGLRSRRLSHAGLSADLDATISAVSADPRVSSLLVVGFSMGGQLSLLTAARWGAEVPASVAGVVAISAPFALDETSALIERPSMYPYKMNVLRSLKATAIALSQRHPDSLTASIADLRALRSIRDYDRLVVAPMHGFASAEDYYAQSSCGPRLGQISAPTLVVAASDDPMVPVHTLMPFLSGASRSVTLRLSARGGHVGFVERLPGGIVDSWANAQIVSWLQMIAA